MPRPDGTYYLSDRRKKQRLKPGLVAYLQRKREEKNATLEGRSDTNKHNMPEENGNLGHEELTPLTQAEVLLPSQSKSTPFLGDDSLQENEHEMQHSTPISRGQKRRRNSSISDELINSCNVDPDETASPSHEASVFNTQLRSEPSLINEDQDSEILSESTAGVEDSSIASNANNSTRKKPGNPLVDAANITGRRLFEPSFFINALLALKTHSSYCSLDNIELFAEQRFGYFSTFHFHCKMCNRKDLYVSTENKNDKSKLHVNTAIVSGALAAGGGHALIKDIAMSLNMPSMKKNGFLTHQARVSTAWDEIAQQLMKSAIDEEIEHAKRTGNVTENGIPLISVVCDGCWARRSYRTNYTSLSGMAAIVGYHTQKVLYFGVKNKYCYICQRASVQKLPPPTHACYKNWGLQQSSAAMEAAVVTEGFCSSLPDYGVIYNKMIADGDSNVYKKIREANPYKQHNIVVEKIECRNHLLRNFDSKMRKIATTGGRGQSTGFFRKKVDDSKRRMRIAVTCAIKQRKDEDGCNHSDKITNLKNDILNMPYHIFGQHQMCPAYFCKGPKEGEKNIVPDMKNTVVWEEMYQHVRKLALCARSLICDVDNNIVEGYNSGLAKLNGGKRINNTLRGGFNTRCAGAVISHNDGRMHYLTHKNICEKSPGFHTKQLEAAKLNENRREKSANSRARRPLGIARNVAQTADDSSYGERAQRPDLSADDYAEACTMHMAMLKKSQQEIREIERRTVQQRESHEWLQLHQNLLTASSFHRVTQRRPYTSCAAIVKGILYTKFDNDAMKWGRDNEDDVRFYLSQFLDVDIQECGLFIDPEYNFLAASPDGLIGDDTLVEIKCSYSAAELKLSPEQAIRLGKVGLLHVNKEGEIVMNKKDKWYIQIQGQLNITGRKKCIFALYTPIAPYFHIEEIDRDEELWQNELLPKLVQFYEDSMLPELVDARQPRSMQIREPAHVTTAQKEREAQRAARTAKATERAAFLASRKTRHIRKPTSFGAPKIQRKTSNGKPRGRPKKTVNSNSYPNIIMATTSAVRRSQRKKSVSTATLVINLSDNESDENGDSESEWEEL